MAIQNGRGFSFKDFNSYAEFKYYHESVPDSSHYEIISGKQSLYFDFDGEINQEQLVFAIRKRLNIYPLLILLYSSCDALKSSYHVIVKGIYLMNHLACKKLATEIIQLIRSSFKEDEVSWLNSFDSSVYSSKRNLRLLGSRKMNSTRVKVFSGVLYATETSELINNLLTRDQLYLSLASLPTGQVIEIATEMPAQEFTRPMVDLTGDEVAVGLELIESILPGVFSKRQVTGKTIFLQRRKPAQCPICDRVHDNDGGILSLRKDGFYFLCFRDTHQSLRLQDDEEVVLQVVQSSSDQVEKEAMTIASNDKPPLVLYAEKLVRRYGF